MKGFVYESGDFRITITTDAEQGQVKVEVIGIPEGQSADARLQGWFGADEAQDMAEGFLAVAAQTERVGQ